MAARAGQGVAHQGRLDEALALAREASSCSGGPTRPIWRADALVDQAEVFARAARLEEPARELTEALRLYEAKGDLTSARTRARALARIELERICGDQRSPQLVRPTS